MKRNYIKPELTIIDLRPEEQIGARCNPVYVSPNYGQSCTPISYEGPGS